MLQGVIPALLTPFTEDGKNVDTPALKRLCDHLVEQSVAGLFVTGTTGEFVSLSPDERRHVIREVLHHVGDRLRVLVHIGSFNTAEALSLTEFALQHGAKGVGCMPPYFYTLDDEALYAHFSKVCEQADGSPVYLYNIPGTAINEIGLDIVKRLKEHYPHVKGIKESSGQMDREQAMLDMNMSDFQVINGTDEKTLTALRMGVRASVSSTANVFPEAFDAVYDAFAAGDDDAAEEAQAKMQRLTKLLGHGRYLASYKQALRWKGVDVGFVRPPHRELRDDEIGALRSGLTELGLL